MAYSLAKKTETGWFLGREESTLFWSVSLLLFVQFLSSVWLFVTPWTAARQASLSFTISESSVRFVSIESVMLSNHLILCHPLLILPSIFPSIRVFSNESALHIRWPKYWSFSFSISPSSEYSGFISLRTDWSPCCPRDSQESSPASYFESINCFGLNLLMDQLSHPYMTTGKTIILTVWTFVSKVMSLLFNMVSRFVIGEGNGNPLQYSCLENPIDGGAW